MTDPSQLSDADLMSAIQQAPDVGALVTAAAQRHGVPPQLALGVAHAESGMDPNIGSSPKGAIGVMQLMPGTARDLGVDPTDLAQNIDGGVSYLRQQLDRFKDPKLAAAAYNAGPEAVARSGGVPNYPETQAYVQKVNDYGGAAQMSDADLLKALGEGGSSPPAPPATSPPVLRSHNGGVTIGMAGPEDDAPAPAQPPLKSPTVAQDAVSGFAQPFVTLGHDVMQRARQLDARAAGPLPSLGGALHQAVGDGALTLKMLGDVLGLTAAPAQAIVRPVARAITNYGPTPYSAPQLSMQAGRPVVTAGQPLTGDAAQAANEGLINTALAGARPKTPGGFAVLPKAQSLDDIKAASDAAWAALDNSGFRFPKADATAMADDVKSAFQDAGGADLYPRSAPLVNRIDSLANSSDGLSVAQVNRLRSQIGAKLLQPGSDEADMGALLRNKVEGLIQTANDPSLAEARDLYTRQRKMQEVTDRTDSAALKTPQNGSITQPVRAAMRPLIDPKSPQRIKNLTPDEIAGLKKLATGTAADAPLAVGRFFDPRSLVGNLTNTLLGGMTHGAAPFVTGPIGIASTAASNARTSGAIKKLLDLMSVGGAAQKPAEIYPTSALGAHAPVPILSAPGLIGGTALTTLPARIAAAQQQARATATPQGAAPGR